MNDPGPYYRPPGLGHGPRPSRMRWLPVVIGLILVAVAALILLMLVYPASFGLTAPTSPYGFGRFGGVFALFFILIVVFFIVRVAFWSTRASRYGRRYDPDRSGGDRTEPARDDRPDALCSRRDHPGTVRPDPEGPWPSPGVSLAQRALAPGPGPPGPFES